MDGFQKFLAGLEDSDQSFEQGTDSSDFPVRYNRDLQ